MYKIVKIVPFIILRMTGKNENSREIKNAKNLNLNTNFLGGSGGVGGAEYMERTTYKWGSSQMRTIAYKGGGGV